MNSEYDNIDVEGLLPQDEESSRRRKDIASQLEYLSGDSYYEEQKAQSSNPLISTDFLQSREKGKKKSKKGQGESKESVAGEENWFSSFMDDMKEAEAGTRIKQKHTVELEDIMGGKKKRKKKKKKGEPTDFRKEFETENSLYTNILRDTTRFVDSLQREYDSLTSKKGAGRGTTKNVQDMVANIISARKLAADLVDKKVNLKKLATELSFKERKELGLDNLNSTDMGEHASAYLKQLIDNRTMLFNSGSDEIADIEDGDVDMFLDESMDRPVTEEEINMYGASDRTKEADLYLKYENANVTTYISINSKDTSDYYYYAVDEEGNLIEDYPLPVSKISSINRSTGFVTDEFGQKYPIDWR